MIRIWPRLRDWLLNALSSRRALSPNPPSSSHPFFSRAPQFKRKFNYSAAPKERSERASERSKRKEFRPPQKMSFKIVTPLQRPPPPLFLLRHDAFTRDLGQRLRESRLEFAPGMHGVTSRIDRRRRCDDRRANKTNTCSLSPSLSFLILPSF